MKKPLHILDYFYYFTSHVIFVFVIAFIHNESEFQKMYGQAEKMIELALLC